MREMGLSGVRRGRSWIRATISDEGAERPADLVDRDFAVTAPNRLWLADLTYVKSHTGWVYVAFIIDAYSLEMAVGARSGQVAGIVFHSDRGSQYLSGDYRNLIEDHEMVQSVGPTGVSADNAVAEAAWSSLKRELVSRYRFDTRDDARRAIFAWINRYNTRRRHSSLGYITPTEWETQYHQTQADQAA